MVSVHILIFEERIMKKITPFKIFKTLLITALLASSLSSVALASSQEPTRVEHPFFEEQPSNHEESNKKLQKLKDAGFIKENIEPVKEKTLPDLANKYKQESKFQSFQQIQCRNICVVYVGTFVSLDSKSKTVCPRNL
jgi:hypothetical protein